MSAAVGEFAHFTGAVLSGGYIVWSVVERISLKVTDGYLTPFAAYSSLWIALLLIPFFVSFRNQHHYLRGNRINGCKPSKVYPHRDPIFGSDMLRIMLKAVREHSVLDTWHAMFHNLGTTYWTLATGKWIIMTEEPENFKSILSTDFESWPLGSIRKWTLHEILGPHAIFSVNGTEWQHARAMIRPSFVRNQITDLECTDRHVDNFLAKLPKDGSKFDMQELLYYFTMDVSTDFMFGYSTNILTNPTKEALDFTNGFDYTTYAATSRGRLGRLALLLPDRKFSEHIKICNRFVDAYVAEAMSLEKEKERSYIFMHEIIKSGATPRMVRDQLMALILGGRDTSASTMTSLFWILARRPDVVKKLRTEISDLDGRKPTWEELKNLKYLNMVLKEALRLWAPVTSNMRTSSRDTVLPRGGGPDGQGPMFVPKGTDCRFVTHSMHRRKEFYGEDAEEFNPERWDSLRPSWEYLPFSGGPRICIGQQFALTQMLYLIARVFQYFDQVKPADDDPMLQKVTTTMSMVNGCWINLTLP